MDLAHTTPALMEFDHALTSYEEWLGGFVDLTPDGRAARRATMDEGVGSFLRATYFRWAQAFPRVCSAEVAAAPRLLGVGDLHVESFATWRDAEGRLAWGVGAFPDAAKLPYTSDLVRLCVSAKLLIEAEMNRPEPAPPLPGVVDLSASKSEAEAGRGASAAAELGDDVDDDDDDGDDTDPPALDWRGACDAVAEGYGDAMADAVEEIGRVNPILLAESHGWLAQIAAERAIDPERFWRALDHDASDTLGLGGKLASSLLRSELSYASSHAPDIRWRELTAAPGALGLPRYMAESSWLGGRVTREAAALAPAASYWARGSERPKSRYAKAVKNARRAPDPFLRVVKSGRGWWSLRRMAPDCAPIRAPLLRGKLDEHLFHAMGHEIANVHLGQPERCREVLEHLHALGPQAEWLQEATLAMERQVLDDHAAWRAR